MVDELHITPLQAVMQLRPSFHQVDERDSELAETTGTAKDAAKNIKQENPSGVPQVYQVTIKRAGRFNEAFIMWELAT